jgi:hypothetical protein
MDTVLVSCSGGTGTVTWRTATGLAPGQAAVLNFRLLADDTAQPGTVTISVTAGAQVSVPVSVRVNVKPPSDAVDLNLWVVLDHRPQTGVGVTVTAKLGTTTPPSSPRTPFIRTGH